MAFRPAPFSALIALMLMPVQAGAQGASPTQALAVSQCVEAAERFWFPTTVTASDVRYTTAPDKTQVVARMRFVRRDESQTRRVACTFTDGRITNIEVVP